MFCFWLFLIVEQINDIFQENRSNWCVTFWEKGVGHPKIQHGGNFFKMPSNAHYVNRSNSDVGITFCENTLLRMFFWEMVLVPQKFKMATIFQDGHHFYWILTSTFQMVMLSSNLVQIFFKEHSHGKRCVPLKNSRWRPFSRWPPFLSELNLVC